MKNELQNKIYEAIVAGLAVRGDGRGYGCGRAYVAIGKVERKVLIAVQKAAAQANIRYLPEAYGAGKRCLYIGYDNATGVPLAQSRAIAKNLKEIGIEAYDEAVDD